MIQKLLLGIAGLALASVASAQAPLVTVQKAPCVPVADNVVLNATVKPEVGGTSVRLFFRWNEHGAMYYVDMIALGGGAYWGLPAKPEPRNENLEYYVAVVDPTGKVLGKSETQLSPVADDCPVNLTDKQIGVANNLIIGETAAAQEGKRVLGFLCDGVVTRINHVGVMRPDEVCRGCVIPWWTKEEFVGSALLVPTTSIIIDQPPPVSPSRP
jgi:hypothetical protein